MKFLEHSAASEVWNITRVFAPISWQRKKMASAVLTLWYYKRDRTVPTCRHLCISSGVWYKISTATSINKVVSGYQPCLRTKTCWSFRDYLCFHHQSIRRPDDGFSNVGKFYFSETAVSPRRFYWYSFSDVFKVLSDSHIKIPEVQCKYMRRVSQSVQCLTADWTSGVRSLWGRGFFLSPVRIWGQSGVLYNIHRKFFPGAWCWTLTPF
jgi:hypothetical protein